MGRKRASGPAAIGCCRRKKEEVKKRRVDHQFEVVEQAYDLMC
jgi:hypothetical protein